MRHDRACAVTAGCHTAQAFRGQMLHTASQLNQVKTCQEQSGRPHRMTNENALYRSEVSLAGQGT